MIKRFFIPGMIALLWSCGSESEVDISEVNKQAHFTRFDSAFFHSDTTMPPSEIERLARLYPPFFEAGKTQRFWKSQRNDPNQQELFRSTQSVLDNFEALNENLNFSMKHYYYYFPETPEITFYGYISNLDFDFPVLYVPSQALCFVGLDLYLGQDKKYYSSQAEYLAYYRQPAFLVRDCIDAVIEPKVKRKETSVTLLDDMIYYGKRLYYIEKMMPQKDPTIIIQYPPEQLEFCRSNERTIWAYFVENNHLFDTSQDLKRRFIEIAPFSKFRMQFDNQTPGMIGRWVGWQIVRDYMENNPSITLEQLGQETDSRKILKLSGYKP